MLRSRSHGVAARRPGGRPAVACFLLWLGLGQVASGQDSTANVFDRYGPAVVKIEVAETGSGAKGIIGSGFFVGDGTRVVTNFHVISRLVHRPERYAARIVAGDDLEQQARLVGLDVLHDLALLEVETASASRLTISPIPPAQGTRLYALGFPHDLGITIVEGTYNGRAEHSLYGRLHFTGSLNSGMSGGPAITEAGEVVGVNVATAGNQVSFLVSPESVASLLADAAGAGAEEEAEETFLAVVRRQLLDHQEVYHGGSLVASGKTVKLGPYRVPTEPAPFFNCWADASRDPDTPYEVTVHQCRTDDELFIAHGHRSGIVGFRHRVATTDELDRFRFYQLLTSLYDDDFGWSPASAGEVTAYRCESGFVEVDELTLKVAFCARRYRKLEGLYDVVLKAASLGEPRVGLETSLMLSGVTIDKGRELARGYLEAFRWEP